MKRFMLISLPLTSLVLFLVGVSLPASATTVTSARFQQAQMYRLDNHR